MLDRTKKYFFHNIYGAEQALIDQASSDVVIVPIGWSEEAEAYRNQILGGLTADNIDNTTSTYSTMPDVLFWRPAYRNVTVIVDEELIDSSEGRWDTLGIPDFSTDTTWSEIDTRISEILSADTPA